MSEVRTRQRRPSSITKELSLGALAVVFAAAVILVWESSAKGVDRTPTSVLGGGVTIGYDSFAERASGFDGVAVVRVLRVGPPEWNTVDGKRPSDDELNVMLSGPPKYDYFIGQPVAMELVDVVRGQWNAPEVTIWWRPGGDANGEAIAIGDDVTLPTIAPGQLAVAFTFDSPREPTPGVTLYVGELYAVGQDGLLETPLPSERIRLADLPPLLASMPER